MDIVQSVPKAGLLYGIIGCRVHGGNDHSRKPRWIETRSNNTKFVYSRKCVLYQVGVKVVHLPQCGRGLNGNKASCICRRNWWGSLSERASIAIETESRSYWADK